jgi:hypothetical protein
VVGRTNTSMMCLMDGTKQGIPDRMDGRIVWIEERDGLPWKGQLVGTPERHPVMLVSF